MENTTREKVLVEKEIATSCVCDVCGKTIWKSKPRTQDGFDKRKFAYYFHIHMGHYGWGNDSVDSVDSLDACSPDCLRELLERYFRRKEEEHYTMYLHIDGTCCRTEE